MELRNKVLIAAALLPVLSFAQYSYQEQHSGQRPGYGPASVKASPNVYRLGLKDSGHRISVRRGDIIAIDLGESRRGDMDWRLLKKSDNLREARESDLPGNRDYYKGSRINDRRNVFYFEATRNGNASLDFGFCDSRRQRISNRWNGVFTVIADEDRYDDRYDDRYGNGYNDGDWYGYRENLRCDDRLIGVYKGGNYGRYDDGIEVVINLQSRNSAVLVVKSDRGLRRKEVNGYWYMNGNQVVFEYSRPSNDYRYRYNDSRRYERLVFVVRGRELIPTAGTRDYFGCEISHLVRIK